MGDFMKKGFLSDIKYALNHIDYDSKEEKEIKKSFKELKELVKAANALKKELYDNGSGNVCCCVTPKSKNYKVIYDFVKANKKAS